MGFQRQLGSADYVTLREILGLPLQPRGCEHVKNRNRAQLALRQERLKAHLVGAGDPVQIIEAATPAAKAG